MIRRPSEGRHPLREPKRQHRPWLLRCLHGHHALVPVAGKVVNGLVDALRVGWTLTRTSAWLQLGEPMTDKVPKCRAAPRSTSRPALPCSRDDIRGLEALGYTVTLTAAA